MALYHVKINIWNREYMWKRERERKYIKDYIVLSSTNNNILQETSIYKNVISSN